MTIENSVENKLIDVISAFPALSSYQIVNSRQITSDYETRVEKSDKDGIIAIVTSHFRPYDNTLPLIEIPFSLSIQTKVENDITQQKHDAAIEAISKVLAEYGLLDKVQDMSTAFSTDKFLCSGLFSIDGSGLNIVETDKGKCYSETITFRIAGTML